MCELARDNHEATEAHPKDHDGKIKHVFTCRLGHALRKCLHSGGERGKKEARKNVPSSRYVFSISTPHKATRSMVAYFSRTIPLTTNVLVGNLC